MTKRKHKNPPKPKFGDVICKQKSAVNFSLGVIISLESLAFDIFETLFCDGKIGKELPKYARHECTLRLDVWGLNGLQSPSIGKIN